jgi:hypothetical protein
MKVGDLVQHKWSTALKGHGVILGWCTINGRPMARLLWTSNGSNTEIYQIRHHLEVISEGR